MQHPVFHVVSFCLCLLTCTNVFAGTKTWDGKYDTSRIEVTVVYFVPSDRTALVDWRERVDYFSKRLEQFHQREFGDQSVMKARVHPEPLVSEQNTAELRVGDANRIYFRTLSEVDRRLKFAAEKSDGFPILLVLSEINWRPLDDFYRLHPGDNGLVFEGNYHQQQHFPGATSGGARAAYLADRGIGWGLVSADGWRVPYRGSDCVVYHEGCGHTVGLPHPEPQNGSVMSVGQYRGWISESWLDKDQKIRLGWEPQPTSVSLQHRLFSEFTAIPEPLIPAPNQPVKLKLTWPDGEDTKLKSLRIRYQTALHGPWGEVPVPQPQVVSEYAELGVFDRETPVSYRVDVQLESGETAELWGYFQVRNDSDVAVQPRELSADLMQNTSASTSPVIAAWPENEVDLLSLTDVEKAFHTGQWNMADGKLTSPQAYGARLELPYEAPEEYRLTAIVEPLDQPNGLLFGHRSGQHRFVTLFHYDVQGTVQSAIENINGRNVGNESTFRGAILKQNQLSQIVVTVRKTGVTMSVDGRSIVAWKGNLNQLSLSDYWSTPNPAAIFVGAYNCRYRFHRISVQPL